MAWGKELRKAASFRGATLGCTVVTRNGKGLREDVGFFCDTCKPPLSVKDESLGFHSPGFTMSSFDQVPDRGD